MQKKSKCPKHAFGLLPYQKDVLIIIIILPNVPIQNSLSVKMPQRHNVVT
jgi:hypothetical protein